MRVIIDRPPIRPCKVVIAVLAAQLAAPCPSEAAAPPTEVAEGDNELMVRADIEREAGGHAEAARLFAQAYRAMSREQQTALMGEIVIRNAIADYTLGLAPLIADGEQVDACLALLRDELQLLRQFSDARAMVPPDIARARVEVASQIEEVERWRADAQEVPDVGRTPQVQQRAIDAEPLPPNDEAEPEALEDVAQRHSLPSSRRARATGALLGIGAASVVGGMAMVVGGGWMLGEARDRRNASVGSANVQLAALTWNDADLAAVQSMLDDFGKSLTSDERRARTSAMTMIAMGSVLASTGIGFAAWGAARRHNRSRASPSAVLAPTLTPREWGMSLRMSF